MKIGIHHCWHCGNHLDDFFGAHPFHCNEECQRLCKYENYKPKDAWDEDDTGTEKDLG